MNYNLISQLISKGFEGEDILPLIMKNAPHLAKKIKSLLTGGWQTNEVLEALQQDPQMSKVSLNKPSSPNEIAALKVFQGRRSPDKSRDQQALENLQGFTKQAIQTGAGLGGTALGAYALNRALPKAASALQGLLPGAKSPQQAAQQLTPQPPAQQPPQALPAAHPQGMQPQPSSITPQPTQSLTPPKTVPLPEALQKQASAMLKAGNDINKIEGALKSIQPKVVNEYEKATNAPIRAALEDFAKQADLSLQQPTTPSGIRQKAQEAPNAMEQPPSNEIPEPIRTITPTTPGGKEALIEQGRKKYQENMGKGSTVALPSGEIGEISDIRQGIATVNSNGKEYRRKVEELIEPPMEQKDLADLYKDLISGIESKSGEEISRMVNWAGYDPNTNELAFVPHLGALYTYDNISPEDAAELTNILSQRKTTGENFIGAWKEGSKSPIGAAMSRLIQKLQKERGGKGSEYKGKYEKIYDALELPKIEAKAKHAQQKKSEKPITKNPRKSTKSEVQVLEDRIAKEHTRLRKMDDDFLKEDRSGKKVDPKVRALKMKMYDEQEKRVSDLQDAIMEAGRAGKKR